MLTYTKPGDSPYSVAERLFGQPDKTFAKALWQQNKRSLARHLMNDSGVFAPNRFLWVPEQGNNQFVSDLMVHHTEFYTSAQREMLIGLMQSGGDINQVVTATNLYAHLAKHSKTRHRLMEQLGLPVGLTAATAEFTERRVDLLQSAYDELVNVTQDLAKAFETDWGIAEAIGRYKAQFKTFSESFARELKVFGEEKQITTHLTTLEADLEDPWPMLKKTEVWIVRNIWDLKHVDNALKWVKRLSKGAYFAEFAIGGYQTYTAYRDGGDWHAKLVEAILDVVVDYFIGQVATSLAVDAMVLPPPFDILVAGAVLCGGVYASTEAIDALNKYIDRHVT